MVSFLTVSQNQSKNNLPVQGNDGVLFSKKVREKDFHFLGMLFEEYRVRFLKNG